MKKNLLLIIIFFLYGISLNASERVDILRENLKYAILDIGNTYFVNKKLSPKISDMTNVYIENEKGHSGELKTNRSEIPCIKIEIFDTNKNTNKPAYLKLTPINEDKEFCKEALEDKEVKNILNSTFKFKDINKKEQTSQKGEIDIAKIYFNEEIYSK